MKPQVDLRISTYILIYLKAVIRFTRASNKIKPLYLELELKCSTHDLAPAFIHLADPITFDLIGNKL